MIRSYQMPNYWTWKIFLCTIDDDLAENVEAYYNESEGTAFHETFNDRCSFCLCDEDEMIGVVCIRKWELTSYKIGLLVHEIMHLLICISHKCECPININTTECWAYTIDSFVDTFIDVLEKEKAHNEQQSV